MYRKLFLIALGNLTARPFRTCLIAGGIGLSCWWVQGFSSYVTFVYESLSRQFILESGHLQVVAKGGSKDASKLRNILNILENRSSESIVVMEKALNGLVSSGEFTVPFMGKAVAPKPYFDLRSEQLILKDGTFEPFLDGQGLLIAPGLANRLHVSVGDFVTLLVTDPDGRINAMDLLISGILAPVSSYQDQLKIVLPLGKGWELDRSQQADKLMIRFYGESTDTVHFLKDLQSTLVVPAGWELTNWRDQSPFFGAIRDLYSRILFLVALIIGCVVVVGVGNTLVLNFREKKVEAWTLKALGAPVSAQIWLYTWEGILYGVLGAGMGSSLFGLTTVVVRWLGGIPMPPPPNFSAGYQLFLDFQNEELMIALLTVALTFVVSVLYACRNGFIPPGRLLGAVILCGSMGLQSQSANAKAKPSPEAVLASIEKTLNIPNTDYLSVVRFVDYQKGSVKSTVDFAVASDGQHTLAFAVSDPKGRRMAILSQGQSLWMQTEKMRQPIRILPHQRLLGQASNADVIAVKFSADYRPVHVEISSTTGRVLLELTKKEQANLAAYSKIRLVCDGKGRLEGGFFYALSGKLIKKVSYAYSDQGVGLETITVTDAVNSNLQTVIQFLGYKPFDLEEHFFGRAALLNSARSIESNLL